MIHSVQPCRGALRDGFTLLEMCIVLFIIVLFVGAMTPAMQSVLAEQTVRNDTRQIAYLVRSAMLQSSEQHRPFALDLTSTTLDLRPVAGADDVTASRHLDRSDKLLVPDPKKANAWTAMPPTTWLFRPGELCPASRLRLAHGKAWMELNFNALTGNIENESSYFP